MLFFYCQVFVYNKKSFNVVTLVQRQTDASVSKSIDAHTGGVPPKILQKTWSKNAINTKIGDPP